MNSSFQALPATRYGVVDLFAGPGGLAEGFSALKIAGRHPFKVELSIEMHKAAHRTLLLRTFLREFETGFPDAYYNWLNGITDEPDWCALHPEQWQRAEAIARCLELGNPEDMATIEERIRSIKGTYGASTILIGGPPCQAYSLVGRARNTGRLDYDPTTDYRHFLYEAYIKVLEWLKPAAFVMGNVKGMLSASVGGEAIFAKVLADLRAQGYHLLALAPRNAASLGMMGRDPEPADFVIRAEDHGVPQARHRVIVVGIRNEVWHNASRKRQTDLEGNGPVRPVLRHVLEGMPVLRSGLSGKQDDPVLWQEKVLEAARFLENHVPDIPDDQRALYKARALEIASFLQTRNEVPGRASTDPAHPVSGCPDDLSDWLADARLTALANHETRGHMTSDLGRYLFAALFAETMWRSPKASEFPAFLAPKHENWDSVKFADRFCTQVWSQEAA